MQTTTTSRWFAHPSSTRRTHCRASSSTSPTGVAIKIVRTPEDVRASAQTCANAFAYEQRDQRAAAAAVAAASGASASDASSASDGGGGAADHWLTQSAFTLRVMDILDARYAAAITRELEQMVSHHAEMRVKAKAKARDGRTEARERARAVASARSVTMLARFASSSSAETAMGVDSEALPSSSSSSSSSPRETSPLPTWIGSASLRVCAPEALLPEPFPTTKRIVPYVSNVAVDVRARGAGVASALLVKCERATRMWGYPELYLHVDVGNVETRKMYERRGYDACGEDPWWWGLGGVWGARRILLKKDVSKPPLKAPSSGV